jgi:vacuolar-type H+-ATPase subunit I/STV1
MNRTTKNLLVIGGTMLVLSIGVPFVFGIVYGIWMGFHMPRGGASQQQIQQMAAREMAWILPVAITSEIVGFIGFLMLAVGLVKYFLSRRTTKPV